ncbi:MAG TPA: cellulose binding domain-containing protein [Pseudobacteroides sp.]|uniref:cellulose binding domain-containing protein n=1 Tax=Pseudobacteroides sp. TaxID=1968840 RepID=UPI002F956498
MTFTAPLSLPSQVLGESQWVFKKSMPFGIGVDKSYQFGDKIYAMGYSPDMGSTGFICYDPLLEQTSWIRSVNSYGWGSSAGYNNKIYVFSGLYVDEYDINTGDRLPKNTLPYEKDNGAIVELNGKIYIINGSSIINGVLTIQKSVLVYDPVMNNWGSAADTNFARFAPNATALNGKIYLFGGWDNQSNSYSSIEEYNPITNKWTLISNYLPCSINSKFVSMGNKIYALCMDALNPVYEYDPAINQWKKYDSIPEKYGQFAAESMNGKIYVMGGRYEFYSSSENDPYSKNILEFDPSKESEPTSSPTPTPTSTPTPTQTPTSTVTQPTNTTGNIKVQAYNSISSSSSNQISPYIKVINTGSTSINLKDIKARYYFTYDGVSPLNYAVDWSDKVLPSKVTSSFVSISSSGADRYLDIGFTVDSGTLAPGSSIVIQGRIYDEDWNQSFNQSNDYSFNSTATNYVDTAKVTGWIGNSLMWGQEP